MYSYNDFYNRLNKQSQELSHGGTDYRQNTAKLALLVADNLNTLRPFLDLSATEKLVRKYLPDVNEERVRDVVKMLFVNARALEVSSTRSAALKAYVGNKMKNREPIKLVKVKQ